MWEHGIHKGKDSVQAHSDSTFNILAPIVGLYFFRVLGS